MGSTSVVEINRRRISTGKYVIGLVSMLVAMLTASVIGARAEYPEYPVKVIVGYGAGGSTDVVARIVAQRLSEYWNGKPVVVENRPGGNGLVGILGVKTAPADGYTILMGVFAHAVIETLLKDKPYSLERDFVPVIEIGRTPQLLLVNPNVPAKNVGELLALLKAEPGKLNFGAVGNGSASQMASELFLSMSKTSAVGVNYRSSGAALNDLLVGSVQFMFDSILTSLPLVNDGRLRALAVSGGTRSSLAPTVPTVSEAGVAGYDSSVWFGYFVKAGTPKAIVEKLNKDIAAALRVPAVEELIRKQGLEIVAGSQEAFAATVSSEIAKWRTVIEQRGIKSDQ